MKQEIAIIGGSAAGFFTASLLARQGRQVKLFEAADRIDPLPRTLIVTHHIREVLGSLGDSAVINKICRFELFADGRVATISLRQPDLVVERSSLIQELAARAEAAGAHVLTGHRFLNLKPHGDSLSFTVSSNGDRVETSARILVGADGTFSKVARCAGWPDRPKVPLIQAIVNLPKDMPPHTTRIWFLPKETPYFYWLIPHCQSSGVVGLIGEEEMEARRGLEWFLERRGLEPIEFQSAMIPLYTRWMPNHRKIGQGHVYLVGDAAGHVKVTTVGGIVTGFRGAFGVAEAILNGGRSHELQALRRELDRHLLMRRVIHRFRETDYCRLLKMFSAPIKSSLASLTRDETGKLLFHVLLKQPRLVLLGLQSLLLSK